MKYAKTMKIGAIPGFVAMGALLVSLIYFLFTQFDLLFVQDSIYVGNAFSRWMFLVLFLGSYSLGIVLFIKSKGNAKENRFLLLASLLFMLGSASVLVLGIFIHEILGHAYYYQKGEALAIFRVVLFVAGIVNASLCVVHLIFGLVANPGIRSFFSGIASKLIEENPIPALKEAEAPVEVRPQPVAEETKPPVQAETIDVTNRLKEAKAMLDEGLIDQEDFKKIKAHILSSEF